MNSGRIIVLFILFSISTYDGKGQTGFPGYYRWLELSGRADSLYQSGNYRESARTYRQAIDTKVERGIPVEYTSQHLAAACCWSLAGEADSAFFHLQQSLVSDFSDTLYLAGEKDMEWLHSDPRWRTTMLQAGKNRQRQEELAGIFQDRTSVPDGSTEVFFFPLSKTVKELVQADSLPFLSVNHENFRLLFKGKSYAVANLVRLKQQLSQSYRRVLTVLDTGDYLKGINLVFVDSREELRQVTGIAAFGGFALVGQDAVFLVFNDQRRLQATHELFHLVSHELWGITESRLLDEGGAVYTDDFCYGAGNIYGVNHWLLQNNHIFPLAGLISDFDGYARKNDVIAYFEAAGIFQYLLEKHGKAKLMKLRRDGFEQFGTIYGFSVADLEKAWHAFIGSRPVPEGIPWEKFLKEGCG